MDYKKAATLIKASKKMIVITGAGISTNAGIPDYRSKGGLYETYGDNIFTQEFVNNHPKEFYDILREKINGKEPTKAHLILSDIIHNSNHFIVTQNIELLHEKAAKQKNNENTIYHIHGDTRTWHFEDDELFLYVEEGEIPSDTLLRRLDYPRVDIVLFDEELKWPNKPLYDCDLILTIGTSGVVGSVEMLIQAANTKAPLIVINKGETVMDNIADIKLDEDCDIALEKIWEELQCPNID